MVLVFSCSPTSPNFFPLAVFIILTERLLSLLKIPLAAMLSSWRAAAHCVSVSSAGKDLWVKLCVVTILSRTKASLHRYECEDVCI